MKLNKFEEAYLKIISECNNKHIIKEDLDAFKAGKFYKLEVDLNYPECDEELDFYKEISSELSDINSNGIQISFGEYESSPFGGQLEITLFWKGDDFINNTFDNVLESALSLGETISLGVFTHEEISKNEYNKLFKNRLMQSKFDSWINNIEKEIDDEDDNEDDNEDDINPLFSFKPEGNSYKKYKEELKLYDVAENLNTSSEVLSELANHESKDVRWRVAENQNTPKRILNKLSEDENLYVRISVSKNPNTPKEILIKLANDKNEWVREKAQMALNKNK